MNIKEWQEKRIKDIQPRTIKVNLSDDDCYTLSEKAAEAGTTSSELIQKFIRDLVCSYYSNGNDEEALARAWFERHNSPCSNTLLQHLQKKSFRPEVFLGAWRIVQHINEDPTGFNEDYDFTDDELSDFKLGYEEIIDECLEGWNHNEAPDMDKEIALIQAWRDDKMKFILNVYQS